MHNWRKPAAFGAAAFGLTVAFSTWALLSSTRSVHALRDEQPNRIAIEYQPTTKPEFQDVYKMLQDQRVLEKLQDLFSPFLLPEVLTFRTKDCGMVNAWYVREDAKPVVTLCYDLLNHIMQTLPKEPSPEGVTELDARMGQFFWFASHEAGHAMFDIFDAPIWGHEEDAADGFAAFILLCFGKDQAKRLIQGAAWQWKDYMSDYRSNRQVQIRLAGFSSNHGQPEQRFYDLMCMAYGGEPVVFASLTNDGYLPPTRAPSCQYEYRTLTYAFRKDMNPHLDNDLVKKVWRMQWLPDQSAMPRQPPVSAR
jgi:hypothetical protein